jgi:hypothetical protein
MLANETDDLLRVGLSGGQAGDAVHDLLGQPVAGVIEGVTTDPKHLCRTRKLDSVSGSGPDRAPYDLAVAAVDLDVVFAARRGRTTVSTVSPTPRSPDRSTARPRSTRRPG